MANNNQSPEQKVIVIPAKPPSIPAFDRYLGCILGGAIGDALGYPVEFDKLPAIIKKYGEAGITELQPDRNSSKALISDDTQN